MNKPTKACAISKEARQEVVDRDGTCIFCRKQGHQIMHYIPRGRLGLGIKENLAFGCMTCHAQLDQSEHRPIMLIMFGNYLKSYYQEFKDEMRTYRKGEQYETK